MFLVFVKHFLNKDGVTFFSNNWFPDVKEAISIQPGFLSISSQLDEKASDCVHIMLKFSTQSDLLNWAKTKLHDDLVDNLDPYRVRDWEVATYQTTQEDEAVDRFDARLKWEHVTPRTIAYQTEESMYSSQVRCGK